MKNLLLLLLISNSVIVSLSATSHAQSQTNFGIHGMGEVVLERKPELMRMHVNLLAKGKDLPDAIAQLKIRRAEVEKQLKTLGAAKDSTSFGEIELNQVQDDEQRQMEMIMRQRMAQKRGEKGGAKKEVVVEPVKVMITLTAEWAIPEGQMAETLLAVEKLQATIRTADLGGANESEEPTPEEAELAEEMEGMAPGYGGDEGRKPGEPTFVFVVKIPAADREKAQAEAFLAAKQEATELAKAANLELGTLIGLEGGTGIDADYDNDDYRAFYNSPFLSALRQQMSGRNRSGEVMGASLGLLKYRVTVNATFGYK